MKSLMPKIDSNDGLFHNGNPATGEQGTRVTDTWLNNLQDRVRDVQAEAHYVLQKAGFTPKAETQTQLYQAIVKIIDDNRKTASLTQKGEVQLSSSTNSNSETQAATSKAVKTAYDKAVDAKTTVDRLQLNVSKNYIPNSKKSSAVNSNSADTVATSAAVKTAYDLANSKQSPATTLAGYGIRNFKVEPFAGDINTLKTDGIYAITQASRSRNLPVSTSCHIQVIAGGDSSWCRQFAYVAYSTDMYERHQTSYQTDSWSAWKKLNTDGIPIGAVVSFPRAVTNPVGFLKANGTTFNQQTFPDLYRVLGSNQLPDLTRSDVGMTAYFAVDNIPAGWIAFDEIATQVTEQRYPELYRHLVGQYGSIDSVPKATDRFLRNAGNGLSVGQTQEDELKRHVHRVPIDYDSWFDHSSQGRNNSYFDYTTFAQSSDLWSTLGYDNADGDNGFVSPKDTSQMATGGDETRPKSLILKLCIKAINSLDDVVFWIKSHGEVTNAGALDAGRLAQGLQHKADRNHTHTVSQITDFNQSVREIVTQSITQGFTQNLAETGWCKLPNEMILQWGKFNKGHGFVSDEQRLVTFPISFPNKVLFVGLTEFTNAWSYSTTVENRQRMTNSGFYVISQRNDSMYFALGF
ncbi:tail fiber protein [Haemophilus influenzae biotype aegyptius]|nr:tail fiber protein [Haemophilus influenzae biotype aegyptius]